MTSGSRKSARQGKYERPAGASRDQKMFAEIECRQSILQNDLRAVTIRRPYTPTAVFKAYVRAGSRYDADQLGMAHLLEHLLFTGTQSRSNWDIFNAVERIGGHVGGHTHKEYVTVWAVVPSSAWIQGLVILADILCHPKLDEASFAKEKRVVLEEIRAAQDTKTVLHDLFAQTLWQVHPLRYPLRGTSSSLSQVTFSDLLDFYQSRYVTGNSVIIACGDLDHEQVLDQAGTLFADFPRGSEQPPAINGSEPPLENCRATHLVKNLHQTYLKLGVPTEAMNHPTRDALKVIERALGMGGSTRLYQRLRSQESLVHSFHALNVQHEDAGYFAVQALCHHANVARVEAIVREEWERLGSEGMTQSELEAAKGNYVGSLARYFETNLAVAGIFGVEALLNAIEPFAKSIRRVQSVDGDQVRQAAQRYLDSERYVRVTVGPKS